MYVATLDGVSHLNPTGSGSNFVKKKKIDKKETTRKVHVRANHCGGARMEMACLFKIRFAIL